jgi:Ca2+:H+ antiporter
MDPRHVNQSQEMGMGWRDWIDPRRIGWMKLLLVFVPVALGLHWAGASPVVQFGFALVALLPLAASMGEATEHLAHRAGPGIGGLLNATFGNAAELIIALSLLFKGKDAVVRASITGSILGNLLLVLGASLLAGGLRFRTQRFNRTAMGVSATMMVLAAVGMLVPAIFHSLPEVLAQGPRRANLEHELSLAVCVALMLTYLLGLIFSLKTHKDLFNPQPETGGSVEDDMPHGAGWPIGRALGVLLAATAGVALVSEVLAASIEEAGHQWGLTEVFLGVVVVAIVGNAAEHSTAILVAMKNQMDLAVGIAIGSALQIALFVAPVLVFASYLRNEPMDLLFTTMEVVAVILAVMIARMVAEDGESNWLEGSLLLLVYVILGMAFFFLPEERLSRPGPSLTPTPAATTPHETQGPQASVHLRVKQALDT